MLVFRNQTSYNRFWDGRNNFTVTLTSIRNLTRSFLCCSHKQGVALSAVEKEDLERTIRILTAIPYAVKYHLRGEWGAALASNDDNGLNEFANLLPIGLRDQEDEGLGLPLELTMFIESFIKRGHDRGWYHSPQASQLTVQVNTLIDAYGKMETIKTTPVPVAYLIHQKQVLALFCCVLPFTISFNMGWWSVPIVTLITFTLYGIEGIGSLLEDPFGYDRNVIKMDAVVEDARTELNVMLAEWKRTSRMEKEAEMFLDRSRK